MAGSITFVHSTGRTGSSFLRRTLADHPELALCPDPEFRRESLRYLQWSRRSFSPGSIRLRLPLGAYYRSKFRLSRLAYRRSSEPHYVEISNYAFPFLPEVTRLYPKARRLHVIRDPRTFLPSALNRGWFARNRDFRMSAPHLRETSWKEWRSRTRVQRLAWYWMRVNAMILAAQPARTLRFEDIFRGDRKGFGDLLEELGVSRDFERQVSFERSINATRVAYVPGWKDWRSEWREEAREVFRQAEEEFAVSHFYPDLLDGD